tara:strand:+ start:101 stop:463 length:363 start_codon:yes stop_codon:yes gene_type:complete
MTLEELKQDLKENSNDIYFLTEFLIGDEKRGYCRRSFNDLVEHYKVSDELLMTALKEYGFTSYYCDEPRRMVFHKLKKEDCVGVFNSKQSSEFALHEEYENHNNFGKYTPTYLNDLYKSI